MRLVTQIGKQDGEGAAGTRDPLLPVARRHLLGLLLDELPPVQAEVLVLRCANVPTIWLCADSVRR